MVIEQLAQSFELNGLSKDFLKVINSDRFKEIRKNYEEKFSRYDFKVHLKNRQHLTSLLEQAEAKSNEFKIQIKLYNEVRDFIGQLNQF